MLPADVAAFSAAVGAAIADFARWETADGVAHESLEAAMHHDGVHAFLRLLGRDGGTVGPVIQYLHTGVWTHDGERAEGRYRATDGQPETMRPGRLAFRWFPDDKAECVRRDFTGLAGLAWKALRAVTSPHLGTVDGRPARPYRIGPAAKAWALSDPRRLLRDGGRQLRVRCGR